MEHRYFKGTAIFMAGVWEQAIFLAAADCEFLFPLLLDFQNHHFHHSGDDSASVCNVESIQKNPFFLAVYLSATDYP